METESTFAALMLKTAHANQVEEHIIIIFAEDRRGLRIFLLCQKAFQGQHTFKNEIPSDKSNYSEAVSSLYLNNKIFLLKYGCNQMEKSTNMKLQNNLLQWCFAIYVLPQHLS